MNGNRILCMCGRQMGYTLVEPLRLFFGISEEGAVGREERGDTYRKDRTEWYLETTVVRLNWGGG